MNKFGFISSILTWILLLMQFIPLGIIIGVEGPTSFWFGQYFNILNNPWMSSSAQIPLEIFNYGNQQVFLWGIVQEESIKLWYEIDVLGLLIVLLPSLLAGTLSLIGCAKENQGGKKLIAFNFYALLIVIVFIIIGLPLYSQELLGGWFEILDLFFVLNYGFYILLLDLILAAIAYGTHPVGEE